MKSQFLSNYTKETFLEKIKTSLRKCSSFYFSVSFIKKVSSSCDIKYNLNIQAFIEYHNDVVFAG